MTALRQSGDKILRCAPLHESLQDEGSRQIKLVNAPIRDIQSKAAVPILCDSDSGGHSSLNVAFHFVTSRVLKPSSAVICDLRKKWLARRPAAGCTMAVKRTVTESEVSNRTDGMTEARSAQMAMGVLKVESGSLLRRAREQASLTIRQVERLSGALARKRGNNEYYISHGWLTQLEKSNFTPSIYKLFSLSVIYDRPWDELLAFFGISVRDALLDQRGAEYPYTRLLAEDNVDMTSRHLAVHLRDTLKTEDTALVEQSLASSPSSGLVRSRPASVFGYIGLEDDTLYPFIRPGSLIEIDTAQRRVGGQRWRTEHDRPIFFTELRGGFACSWCELQSGRLTLIPSPQSKATIRQFAYPRDAEVIGRVVAVAMQIVNA